MPSLSHLSSYLHKWSFEHALDIHLVDITKQMKEADHSKQAPYAIFKMEFPVPEGTCFIDHSGTEWDVNKLLIIGHYVCEGNELVNMQSGSYGPAQIAFGKTSQVDAKSLVSIVEYEKGPNTAAIMLPSDNEGMIGIIDLRVLFSCPNVQYNVYQAELEARASLCERDK